MWSRPSSDALVFIPYVRVLLLLLFFRSFSVPERRRYKSTSTQRGVQRGRGVGVGTGGNVEQQGM